MTMNKTILAAMVAALAAAPMAAVQAQAPSLIQAPPAHVYSQAELDQMLAPIALYPDGLLSQVLMAATYPIEVGEAARWSRANPGLRGDAAVRAVHGEDWDPSVKSLCAFPEILQRMDENRAWTQALGDAFLAQESQVMDQVQRLRQRAEANGNLRSDDRIRVVHEGPVIVVRPARPEYVYVPYYDPLVVYGTWWWPDYRPVYWAPWPGYVRPRPSYAFWWGRPSSISINFFFGDFDWRQRYVRVAYPGSYYYRQPVYVSRSWERNRWQHDPHHRRSVEYRQADVRQRFATERMERRDTARIQTESAATLQAQPQRFAQPRTEQRDDRRDDRRAARMQSQPSATLQAQPQAVTPAPRVERRDDRREERRVERQAAPAVAPAQPRLEQRDDRRAERQAAMQAQRQAQDAQRQAQQQAHQQAQAAQRQAQQQARQQAQQARQERREERREHRKDRDKG
jgi:hypothetical protein